MSDILHKLITHFENFPGIGPRQARRFTYSLLRRSRGDLQEFGTLLQQLKQSIHECPTCGLYHTDQEQACTYCRNPNRDASLLMVVEKDADMETVEKSGLFNGYYLILGGVLPISGKNQVRDQLVQTALKYRLENNLQEIVLGLSATTEGEQTREYVLDLITPLLPKTVTISTLGRGFATGTELEYSDNETLKSALENRK